MKIYYVLLPCLFFAIPLHATELYDNQDNNYIHVWEIERVGDVSKVGIETIKRGSSVGDSMYLAIAIGKIGKLRNYKYMSILSYSSKEKPHFHFVGFSNREDINPDILWSKYIDKGKEIKTLPVTMFDQIEALSKKQQPLK